MGNEGRYFVPIVQWRSGKRHEGKGQGVLAPQEPIGLGMCGSIISSGVCNLCTHRSLWFTVCYIDSDTSEFGSNGLDPGSGFALCNFTTSTTDPRIVYIYTF